MENIDPHCCKWILIENLNGQKIVPPMRRRKRQRQHYKSKDLPNKVFAPCFKAQRKLFNSERSNKTRNRALVSFFSTSEGQHLGSSFGILSCFETERLERKTPKDPIGSRNRAVFTQATASEKMLHVDRSKLMILK